MPLNDTSNRLRNAHIDELEAAVADRAKNIAEFAAGASLRELLDAQSAGKEAMDRLLAERARLIRELHAARDLRASLALNSESERSTVYF